MSEYERLHVQLIPKSSEALARVVEAQGITRTDVVNRAVQLYDLLLREQEAGGNVLLRHTDGTAERIQFF